MKAPKTESPSSEPAPISDAELCAMIENSPWARMQREADEFAPSLIEHITNLEHRNYPKVVCITTGYSKRRLNNEMLPDL